MRTVFMGNHTVGVIVLRQLLRNTEVGAVFSHPAHPDDGNLYLSVYKTAQEAGVPAYQFNGSQQDKLYLAVKALNPDLIVVADYRYILKKEVLEIPKLGAINFHPSLLPRYRGRAPVNWAIIRGEKEVGLTVHFIDNGVDNGDILLQEKVEVDIGDTIKDIHEKLFPVYDRFACEVIRLFEQGYPPRQKQDESKATIFSRRTSADGLIDWRQNSIDIYNLIRAITYPYPGAFSYVNGKKYLIWSSALVNDRTSGKMVASKPGEICSIDNNGITVKANDGVILLRNVQENGGGKVDFKEPPFIVGSRFSYEHNENE